MTFRVSAEEHEALTKSCLDYGARSIADFARAAVLHRVQMLDSPPSNLSGDLTTLSNGLRDLDVALVNMQIQIRRILGPVGSELEPGCKESSVVCAED